MGLSSRCLISCRDRATVEKGMEAVEARIVTASRPMPNATHKIWRIRQGIPVWSLRDWMEKPLRLSAVATLSPSRPALERSVHLS
jgi:hypothetical protein